MRTLLPESMVQLPVFVPLAPSRIVPSAWNVSLYFGITPSGAQSQTEPARCLLMSRATTEPTMEPSGFTATLTCVPEVIHSNCLLCSGGALSTSSCTLLIGCLPSLHNPATVCWPADENTIAKPSKEGLLPSKVRPSCVRPFSQSLDSCVTMACSLYLVAKLSGVSQNTTAPSCGWPLLSPLSVADIVRKTSKCLESIAFLLQSKPYRLMMEGINCTRSRSAIVDALASQSPRVSS
mmetsp:Transcript_112751/g.324034  ORF Transcript_112751/g.324034 Transcript_112751/m.324034 type:complete len:236 (-) Transcript_112751:251-958(-)